MHGGLSDNYHRSVRISAAALCLVLPWIAAAQESLVARGYNHFYNLEYHEAIADFEQAIAPESGRPGAAQSPGAGHRVPGDVPQRRARKRAGLRHQLVPPPAQAEPLARDRETVPRRGFEGHRARPGPAPEESQRYGCHVRAGDLLRAPVQLFLGGQEVVAGFACATPPRRGATTTGSPSWSRGTSMRAWCRDCTTTSSAACPGAIACSAS